MLQPPLGNYKNTENIKISICLRTMMTMSTKASTAFAAFKSRSFSLVYYTDLAAEPMNKINSDSALTSGHQMGTGFCPACAADSCIACYHRHKPLIKSAFYISALKRQIEESGGDYRLSYPSAGLRTGYTAA